MPQGHAQPIEDAEQALRATIEDRPSLAAREDRDPIWNRSTGDPAAHAPSSLHQIEFWRPIISKPRPGRMKGKPARMPKLAESVDYDGAEALIGEL